MTQLVEVQMLVGRKVRDSSGRVAGKLESIRAEKIGPKCVIHEYWLGTEAFLARAGIVTARLFGFRAHPGILRVPWQQLDLSDPKAPLIRCTVEELRAMQPQLPPDDGDGPPAREVARD